MSNPSVNEASKTMAKIVRKLFRTSQRMFGYDQLKDTTLYIFGIGRNFWQDTKQSINKPVVRKISELGLSKAQISAARNSFQKLLLMYLAFAFLVCAMLVHFLLTQDYSATVLAFSVLMVCLAYAFKFHFWLFQIKQNRLGCTWQEWAADLLGRK